MTARRRAELQADVERAQRWRTQVINDLEDQRRRVDRLAIELGSATDALRTAETKLRGEGHGEEAKN